MAQRLKVAQVINIQEFILCASFVTLSLCGIKCSFRSGSKYYPEKGLLTSLKSRRRLTVPQL